MSGTHIAIVNLSDQGFGVSVVARRLGLAQATVQYHLRRRAATVGTTPALVSAHPSGNARSQVATRSQVEHLLSEGLSRAEIARGLKVSKSVVSYHARRLGETIDERCARRYDWSAVQSFHDSGNGARACIREFGFSSETWHAAVKRGALIARSPFLPVDLVFAAGTPRSRSHLKARLLRLGLRENACERCGLRDWRGEPLSLALHHVNGERDDNRLENLQLLCPNCHSQTENFAGRRRHAPPHAESS